MVRLLSRQAEHMPEADGRMVGKPRRKLPGTLLWACGPLTRRSTADSVQVLASYAIVGRRPYCQACRAHIVIYRAHDGHAKPMQSIKRLIESLRNAIYLDFIQSEF